MRYLALPLVLLGLLSGCGSKEAPTEKEETAAAAPGGEAAEKGPADRVTLTAAEQQVGGVRLGALTERPMSGGLKVNGVLDVPPENLVSVSAPLGGFVDRTDLLQGSWEGAEAADARTRREARAAGSSVRSSCSPDSSRQRTTGMRASAPPIVSTGPISTRVPPA